MTIVLLELRLILLTHLELLKQKVAGLLIALIGLEAVVEVGLVQAAGISTGHHGLLSGHGTLSVLGSRSSFTAAATAKGIRDGSNSAVPVGYCKRSRNEKC